MKNRFQENITNEEVGQLPIAQFKGEIVIIETPEAAEKACEELLSHKVIGFDSETRPSFKAGVINKTALLQLSTPQRCYLFRLCKMALHKPVLNVLESGKTIKVGADVKNDLKSLQSLRHFRPDGFIDLQDIIAQWGIGEKSVRKMSGIVLGYRVSKAQRLSNWEASSLTPAQQLYAATDAWICVEIYNKLLATKKKALPPKEPDGPAVATPADRKQKTVPAQAEMNPFSRFFRKKVNSHRKEPKNKAD